MEEQTKTIMKFIYGMEVDEKGLDKAFKEQIKKIEDGGKEVTEITKKQLKKENVEFEVKLQEVDIKLFYISTSLMLKAVTDRKEKLAVLIDELENIVAELKEVEK
jgi:hypothetical protein